MVSITRQALPGVRGDGGERQRGGEHAQLVQLPREVRGAVRCTWAAADHDGAGNRSQASAGEYRPHIPRESGSEDGIDVQG